MTSVNSTGFYKAVKSRRYAYDSEQVARLLVQVDEGRVDALAQALSAYIRANLPATINRRSGLGDYRTNPYVLVASATLMGLSDPKKFADFLFNNKLYMGLETSFGKSIEAVVGQYPVSGAKWQDPPEKVAESAALAGLSQEEKARRRTVSVWREVDKSCVAGNRRYLVGVKSGPNDINDTQVEAMKEAIANHHAAWMQETRRNHPSVTELDIVLGITYGTDSTTNNKENQILVKLLEHGFEEEDRERKPGVLIESQAKRVRVYRRVGQEFWSFIGNPANPANSAFVYLEVLLALARALSQGMKTGSLEESVNRKIVQLTQSLQKLMLPPQSLPDWIRNSFSTDELFWLTTAMTAFFDEGI